MVRIGVIQLSGSDSPDQNLEQTLDLITQAHANGATVLFTPEVTNGVIASMDRKASVLSREAYDMTLQRLCMTAEEKEIWLNIGSLALKSETTDKFVNRSFVIDPSGKITSRYDKIHMFDAEISNHESYQESAQFEAGSQAVMAEVAGIPTGLTICYDLRFPHLYRDLSQAGVQIITVPSAFTETTGKAHYATLLKARAIENGCFVIAACQTGEHAQISGPSRFTYGHSMVVSPWGEVLADLGKDVGFRVLDLDIADVEKARIRIPSLGNTRNYEGP